MRTASAPSISPPVRLASTAIDITTRWSLCPKSTSLGARKCPPSTIISFSFTVTGTPTITDDGIASGLDSSNYVKLTNSITLGTDFELYIPFTYPADASTVTSPNNCILRGQSGNTFRMLCSAYAGGYVDFNMSDGTNVLGTPHIIPSGVMNANESAIIVIKQKNQTCTYGYIKNGVYTQTGTKENFPLDMPEIDNFWFGRGSGTSGWVGQIDLKYIKIVKNGSELISGNITGIDTLKPDDYTVVGTPSISADGIASGLDSSNYITCDCINTDGTIYIPVPNIASGVGGTVVTGAYKIYKNSSWTNRFQLLIDTSNTSIWNSGSNFYNQETDKLLLKVVKKGYTYSVSYKLNNNDWVNVPDVTLSVNPTATMINFEGGYNVDLNLYKNVVNGSVINQPCLKIPYTLSADKYGSKIVDAAYRLRVQDAWEQNFKQRYYTLDEVNGNFTLPQGEIYGMINQKANYN